MEDVRMAGTVAAECGVVDTGAKIIYPSLKSNSGYYETVPYCTLNY